MKIGFLIDPLENLVLAKDTSIAMMLEAINTGYQVFTFSAEGLIAEGGNVFAYMDEITINNSEQWYSIAKTE